MANLQYIGARYVPKFYQNSVDPSSSDWESGKVYEALTIVTYNSVSYTSKIPVPATVGDPAANPNYWVKSVDMPAAIASLQAEVNDIKNGALNDNSLEYPKLTDSAKAIIEENARVIFMPNTETQDTSVANGACTVFITKHTKQVIMYDSGRDTDYTAIKSELLANDIEHVDYFILSHYHGDHYQNIPDLKNDGFIDDLTIAYLPRDTTAVAGWDVAQALVRSYFANNTVVTIDSTNPLTVDNFKFDFFNCDASTFAYYESQGYTAGNVYSICSYVHSDEFILLMCGDIDGGAVDYMASLHKFTHCNVMNAPHHGISSQGARAITLCVQPQFAVIEYGAASEYLHDNANDGHVHYINSATVANLNALNIPCYSTGFGALYLDISKNIYTLLNNDKNVCSYRTNNTEMEIFVDASYIGVGYGTEREPFNSLKAALAFINTLNYMEKIKITIVGAYNFPAEALSISSQSAEIEIAGTVNDNVYNVVLDYINIENATVTLRSLNLAASSHHAVQAINATVRVVECLIDGDTTSYNNSYQGAAFSAETALIRAARCTIQNHNVIAYAAVGGSIFIDNSTGSNNKYAISGASGAIVEFTSDIATMGATNVISQRYSSVSPATEIHTPNYNFSSNCPFTAYSDNKGGTSGTVIIDLSARIFYGRIFRVCSNNGEIWQFSKDDSNVLTAAVKVQNAIDASLDTSFAVSTAGNKLTITYSSIVKVVAI